jgi:DNA-binding transcriptional LysR family regulator
VQIRVGKLTDSRLVARQLTVPRMFLVAAPDYLARAGTPREPDDLKKHSCIRFFNPNSGANVDWVMERDGTSQDVPVNGQLMFNNLEAVLAAAVAGLGVAPAPSFMAERGIAAGLLTQILAEWRLLPEKPVSALWVKDRHASPKVEVFVEFLTSLFPSQGRPPRRN